MPSGQARRGAATLVDVAVWAPVAVLAWRRGRAGEPGERPSWRRRVVLRIPMSMYVIGSTVALGGTPGYRVLGLRVVDRATDENPGWRQAVLRWAAATIPSAIAGEAMRAYLQRRIEPWARRSAELHGEVERLRDEHPDDDEAFDRAIGALNMDLAGGLNLLPPLALYAFWWVATIAMARRDPQRRTLPDRISGTVVVRTACAAAGKPHRRVVQASHRHGDGGIVRPRAIRPVRPWPRSGRRCAIEAIIHRGRRLPASELLDVWTDAAAAAG